MLGWRPLAAVLHDEVTLVGDHYQHSFLIDPFGDFAVSFRRFVLTLEPAQEGALPERNVRFVLRNQWTED
jgi:hypothetical protein